MRKVIAFSVTFVLFLSGCSALLQPSDIFYSGMETFCEVAPKSPLDSSPAYSFGTCVTIVDQTQKDGVYESQSANLFKKLPVINGENKNIFYAGVLAFCKIAPAPTGSKFANMYSERECNNLVSQAIANDYYGQFKDK